MSAARCTGGCCAPGIYFNHTREQIRVMRDTGDPARRVEAAKILTFFRPIEPTEEHPERHACVALTASGCSLSREDRPDLCNRYPSNNSVACAVCGALSDAEARGVALVVM